MKFQDFLGKVKESEDYSKYINQNKGAYLCAGFFVLDYQGGKNQSSVDFYNPTDKKMTTFRFEDKVTAVPLDVSPEMIDKNLIPEKVDGEPILDLEDLKGIILDEMHNRGMTYEIQKIIVVLQHIDDRLIWNCTALLSGLVMLRTHVEDASKSVILMEKNSFFDFIKPVQPKPGQSMKDALEEMQNAEKNKKDPEKSEGEHEGFIG
ncbi:MAG: hypothetical protein AABY22_33790 [Nanoarchaeota archaeon]